MAQLGSKRTESALRALMIVAGAALGAAILIAGTAAAANAAVGIGSVEVRQIEFAADHSGPVPCSEYGEIVLEVTPDPTDIAFLQVGARLPAFGITEWVVRNLPVLPASAQTGPMIRTSTTVDLGLLGVLRGDCLGGTSVELDVVETAAPTDSAPSFVLAAAAVVADAVDNAEGDIPLAPVAAPALAPATTPTLTLLGGELEFVARPGMRNFEVGPEECGPAAVAISMHWLDAIGAIDLGGETLAASNEKLKLDMNPTGWRAKGVTQKETVEGKLRFSKEAGLDIDVHYQADAILTNLGASVSVTVGTDTVTARRDGGGGKPTFAYLLAEMQKGQDVELAIDWLDKAGNKTGGHVLAVSAVGEFAGVRGVFTNDDSEQGVPGGLRTNHYSAITLENGYMRLNGPTRNRVKAIYAESPIEKDCADGEDNDVDGAIDCADSNCAAACGRIGKDPGRIRFGRGRFAGGGHDRFDLHGTIAPTTPIDPATETVAVLLTNAVGVVLALELAPGSLVERGTAGHRFRFFDRTARRARSGVAKVDVRYRRRQDLYQFRVEAYGDLSAAVDPGMIVQLRVGDDPFVNTDAWKRTRNGWKLTLPGE